MVVLTAQDHGPWRWWLGITGVLAGLAVAFWDVLSPARGLFFRDHILVFRPRAAGLVEALTDGRWPGLTRSSAIGVPLEIQLNGTWTPPTALLFLGDVEVAYDAFVIVHFVILAAGVYLLAKQLGADVVSATVACATAVLLGPTVSTENLVVMLQGLSWLPWIGLGLVRLAHGPTWGAVAATALVVGFHLQGIVPVVVLLDLAFGLALAVHLKPSGRAIVGALVAGVWGLLIASIELMPLLTVLGQTERGLGFAYEAQSGWALNPGQLVELWVPSFWAPAEVPILNAPTITGRVEDPPYFTTLYLGLVLPLAVAGGAKRPVQRLLWVAVAGAFVVALGQHTPVHRWVVSLPILSSSRYAIKFTVLMGAALSALAALAVPVVVARPWRLAGVAVGHAALFVAAQTVLRSDEYRAALSWLVRPLQIGIVFDDLDLPAAMLDAQLTRLNWASAMALGLLLVSGLLWGRGSKFAPALAGLLIVDLSVAAAFGIRGVDLAAHRMPKAALAALADAEQRHAIDTTGELPPIAHRAGATRFDDMMRTLGRRGHHAYAAARLANGTDLDGLGNRVHGAVMAWVFSAASPSNYRMLARLGVNKIISPRSDLPLPKILSWPVPGEPDQHLYRLPNVRPYVSAFTRWTVVPPTALRARAHRQHLLNPADHAVVTDGLAQSATDGCPSVPRLTWQQQTPERIEGRIDSPCPVLVVAQEVAVPGWTANVDGGEASLVQAEAGYIGVWVPAGQHRFAFRFRSRSWSWAGLSATALVLALVAAAWPVGRSLSRRPARRRSYRG